MPTHASINMPSGQSPIMELSVLTFSDVTSYAKYAALSERLVALGLIFAAGHAMGAMDSWSPAGETDVLRSMRAFQFDVKGATRTYWHFYIGFGLDITVLLLLQAVLLWQLASLVRVDPSRVRNGSRS